MSPHVHLLIATWSYIISTIVVLGFGFFVFFQKERKVLYTVWLLFCLSMALYQISFIIGVNTPATSGLAYWLWYSNIPENVFIGLFTVHIFILATESLAYFKNVLKIMYATGGLIILGSIIAPGVFLSSVSPVGYFLSYTNSSGFLYYFVDGYFLLCFAVSYYVLFYERRIHGSETKMRIDYYIAGLTFGLVMGLFAFAPDFHIPADPGLSAFVGMFTIPLVYGMIKKGLMSIRIVIRKAVFVTSLILLVAFLFSIVSFLSNWLIANVPGFKTWTIPLLTSFVLVAVGFLYYQKEKEGEELKYEFITVMAHKFRTPLTRIRWQTESLSNEKLPPEIQSGVSQISDSALELIDLSNLLINASRKKQDDYHYDYTAFDLLELTNAVAAPLKKYVDLKKINFSIESTDKLPAIYADKDRLASVIHVLIENAIAYTKHSGIIKIKLSAEEDTIRFEITDNGIGIPSKDQNRIFDGFYRGEQARHADTEGVGLGVSMSKKIVERQGGSMGVRSDGDNMGSTFWFVFPVRKTEK